MPSPRALITGISGQDGSYLAEHLVELGYEVFGLIRRDPRTLHRLAPVVNEVTLLPGDLRDAASLEAAFQRAWPDELYNLAGQSFIPASWDAPDEAVDLNVSGLLRLLRIVERQRPDTRVYQASSAEIFGRSHGPCSETTALAPTSPYGVSKMAAHRLCEVYRQRGLFVVSGVLFNHESPRRAPEMVTRKITLAAARWVHGDRTRLRLGSLDARRDWGYAGDYVKAMRAMLQPASPTDYVIGSGESHSVGEFLATVLLELQDTYGVTAFRRVEDCIETDPTLLRAGEICDLRADPRRAREELGWKPEVEFAALARMMLRADVDALRPVGR